jgi:EmrB/QacA subfamily drug resistance transporter
MDRRRLPERAGRRRLKQRGGEKWLILSVAAAGVLLATIDASIVSIALPTISDYFQTSVQTTAWVTISYLLVVTALLLVFGRLSDVYGQKLVFVSGMIIFTLGSGLCVLSATIGQLIAFRAFQGLGAAMIMSNTPAIVTNAFPAKQRGMGLGFIGSIVSVGLMLGPPLGGMLIHYFGWHYIFAVNLPVGILGTVFALKILKEHRADSSGKPFHPADPLLWVLSVTSFVLIFGIGGRSGLDIGRATIYLTVTIGLVIMFFARQRRSERPLFDPVLLKNSIFMLSSGAGLFSYMGIIGLSFMLPFLLEKSFGMPPLETGKLLIAIPATTVFVSPLAGYLSDKLGQRPIATAGLLISTTSMIFMFSLTHESSTLRLVANLVGLGIGMGLFGSPNNSALMGSVDLKNRGAAGGILATVRNLGMVSGISIVSLVFNSALGRHLVEDTLKYSIAFKTALPVAVAFSIMAIVLSSLRRSV